MNTTRTEINIPYMADIGGKAIPTQGITIRVDSEVPIRAECDSFGNTIVYINGAIVVPSDVPEKSVQSTEEEPSKCGYLSGVPLEIDVDEAFTNAPSIGSKIGA